MSHSTLVTLSVVIAVPNVASMVMVGPISVLATRRWPRAALFFGLGWLLLFAAQILLAIFGNKSDLFGFKYIQPLALLVSPANFMVWYFLLGGRGLMRAATRRTASNVEASKGPRHAKHRRQEVLS